MEYLTITNIGTVVIALIILYNLVKLFKGDISDNKVWSILVIVILGIILYVWRSGFAVEVINDISGTF